MRRLFLATLMILGMLVALPCASAASPDPNALLASLSNKIKSSAGVTVTFKASGSQGSLAGTFKGAGSKFQLTTSQSSVWYDGAWMYTYNNSSKETTKVRPSKSELAESNPLLFVTANCSQFKAAYAKNQSAGTYTLILTPTKKGLGISKATLTVNSKTLAPVKLVARMDGGAGNVTVSISSFKLGSLPASTFDFSKTKYAKGRVVTL